MFAAERRVRELEVMNPRVPTRKHNEVIVNRDERRVPYSRN
jgi:hypothetical protein